MSGFPLVLVLFLLVLSLRVSVVALEGFLVQIVLVALLFGPTNNYLLLVIHRKQLFHGSFSLHTCRFEFAFVRIASHDCSIFSAKKLVSHY